MKKLIYFIFLILFTTTSITAQQNDFPKLTGPYLGQKPPGMTPEIFAPGFVSTGMTEGSITFTSDGLECYWTLHPSGFETILTSKFKDGKWTKPEVVPFASKYLDGFPSINPDGSKLYFHSFRPTGDTVNYPAKLNIWVVERKNGYWSEPSIVPAPVNGKGNSGCPCVTMSGTLYFSRVMSSGAELMVRSRYIDGQFSELEVLSENVNTTDANFHGFIAPDESYLIIPRGGRNDLINDEWEFYISFRNKDDKWSELKNVGYLIQNADFPATPSISADGKYFFYQANAPRIWKTCNNKRLLLAELQEKEMQFPVNGGEDIYWISTDYLKKIKSLKYTNILFGMKETLKEQGIDASIDLYWDLKKKYSDFYDFSEVMLNKLGYQLLGESEIENAIKIFHLNVEVFPDSWNTYDSLAEAYMKDGQNDLAIKNYKKSLELNSNNNNAREKLKELKPKE